jgi:hypothetical protein
MSDKFGPAMSRQEAVLKYKSLCRTHKNIDLKKRGGNYYVVVASDKLHRRVSEVITKQDAATWVRDQILDIVYAHTGVPPQVIVSKIRTHHVANARFIAMYHLRVDWDMSLVKIGLMFSGRDHATVINALKNYQNFFDTNRPFRDIANRVRRDVDKKVLLITEEQKERLGEATIAHMAIASSIPDGDRHNPIYLPMYENFVLKAKSYIDNSVSGDDKIPSLKWWLDYCNDCIKKCNLPIEGRGVVRMKF